MPQSISLGHRTEATAQTWQRGRVEWQAVALWRRLSRSGLLLLSNDSVSLIPFWKLSTEHLDAIPVALPRISAFGLVLELCCSNWVSGNSVKYGG
jgi:hypothetical protein